MVQAEKTEKLKNQDRTEATSLFLKGLMKEQTMSTDSQLATTSLVISRTKSLQQTGTIDMLVKDHVKTRFGLEIFLLVLRRRRKHVEWKVCERYGACQLCFRKTNLQVCLAYRAVGGKLDSKHCGLSMGLL